MTSLPPPRAPERSLRRSRDDQVIAGVAAGLGRYFGVDPVVVRIAFVVLAVFGGSGIVAYIVGWLVIPEERAGGEPEPTGAASSANAGSVVIGIVLVTVGGLLLLDQLVPGFRSLIGPLLLIALGIVVLWRIRR
ncbi:MAG: PspC domain-containing protein [Ilumatobacter sp.]|nr:MAG: PspC domain-containing protein [Ilumatobacter sp.]